MTLSSRVNCVETSKTWAIADQATALVKAGVPLISLSVGEPDFSTPSVIAQVCNYLISSFIFGFLATFITECLGRICEAITKHQF